MVAKAVQGILLIFEIVILDLVLSMVIGERGHCGVTAVRHVIMGHDLATELVVIHHLNIMAKNAQETLLKTATVALVHVLSMVIGQHGQHGVTAARLVPMGHNLATGLAVIHHHNMVANDVQEILLKTGIVTLAHVLSGANGQHGHHGVTAARLVPMGHNLATGIAVIHHLNMVVKTVQEILLISDNVTIVHVLSMANGQHGHFGVSVARPVLMGQNLATELAVTLFQSLGVDTVLAKG